MSRTKRKLTRFLEAGSEHDRLGQFGSMIRHAITPVEITPHAAAFLLWMLEQECSATPLANAIERATVVFDPQDKDPEHRRDYERDYVVPNPVATLRAVTTMRTLQLTFDHAQAFGWALTVVPAIVAQDVLGMTKEEASNAKILSPEGPIIRLLDHFFGDDEWIYKWDTQVVFAQLMQIAMLMLEIEISSTHAVAAYQALTTVTPQIMGGPGRLGRPGRNDPCPCDSGRKYKKCHKKAREG